MKLKPPAMQARTKHLHTKCESHFALRRLRRLTGCYVPLKILAVLLMTTQFSNAVAGEGVLEASPIHLTAHEQKYLNRRIVAVGFLAEGIGGGVSLFQNELASELKDGSSAIPIDALNVSKRIELKKCINRYVRLWGQFAISESWNRAMFTSVENMIPAHSNEDFELCNSRGGT